MELFYIINNYTCTDIRATQKDNLSVKNRAAKFMGGQIVVPKTVENLKHSN